jgi:hypothetical protein
MAGGLVGDNLGTINNCYSTGSVTGYGTFDGSMISVGGLVGYSNGGSITDCHSTSSVTGSTMSSTNNATLHSSVGGLVGYNDVRISNSYSSGNVSGISSSTGTGSSSHISVGGLAGTNWISGIITNSYYSTSSVTGAGLNSCIGGLAGENLGSISKSNSSGNVGVFGAIGGLSVGGLVGRNSGTITECYSMASVSGGWATTVVGGLVGSNESGTIDNSYSTGSVNGNGQAIIVGGLVAQNITGLIRTSYSTSSVTGNGLSCMVGGLVGYNSLSIITDSYSIASAASSGDGGTIGGLVALNNSSTITNCYNIGLVTASGNYSLVGGLVGQNNPGSTISNCYNVGSVTVSGTDSFGGGLVGGNAGAVNKIDEQKTSGTITNCYNIGLVTVSGTDSFGGGLVGVNAGTINSSYWNTETSGQLSSAGGTGFTTAEMMQSNNYDGWSIANSGGSNAVWRVYDGYTYPLLRSFLTPLTVTVNNSTKTYDAQAYTISGLTYSIAGAGSSQNLFGKALYTATSSSQGIVSQAIHADTYSINTREYSNQQGYDISSVGGTLTINKASVTSIAASKTYDGTIELPGDGTMTITGVLLGNGSYETFSGIGTADSARVSDNGSNYVKTASIIGTGTGGGVAGDYDLTGILGGRSDNNTVTITPKSLTVSAIGSGSSTYGSALAYGTASLDGIITGDVVSATINLVNENTSTSGNVRAGSYKQTATGITGADASNYSFTSYTTDTTNYTVSKLALTASDIASGSNVYGGTVTPGTVTLSGLVSSDVVTATASISGASYSTSGNLNAGSYKQKAESITGKDADNYTFSGITTVSENYTVSKLALTGSISTGSSTYGDALSTGRADLTNVVTGDKVQASAVLVDTTGRTSSSNHLIAGSHSGIQSLDGLTGADADNYSFANITGDYNVSKLALTGSINTGSSTYGDALSAGTANLTNVVAGDTVHPGKVVIATIGKTSTSRHLIAGNHSGIQSLDGLTGADADNYSFTNITGDYNVSKLALTGRISAGSSTYGDDLSVGTANLTNVVAGDKVQAGAVVVDTTGKTSTSGHLIAGNHSSIQSLDGLTGADADNYSFANVTGDYTVSKLALTGSISTGSSIYGDELSSGTAILTNVVSGDKVHAGSVVVDTMGNTSTSGHLKAGSYSNIQMLNSISGADAENYTFSAVKGDYTVSKLALTGMSIGDVTTTYGTPSETGAVTFGNVLGSGSKKDDVSARASISDPSYSTSGNLKAGSYKQSAGPITGKDADNYMFSGFTTVGANFTVDKLALTGMSIGDVTTTYGTPSETGAVTFGNVLGSGSNKDQVNATATIADANYSTSGNLKAGNYKQIAGSITGIDADNYTFSEFTTMRANYVVDKLALTGTIASITTEYGTPLTAGDITLNNVVAGDQLGTATVLIDQTGHTSPGGNLNAGSYRGLQVLSALSGEDAGNYTFDQVKGDSMVIPKELTLTDVIASDKIYDSTRTATISNWTIDGLVNGENLGLSGYTATFDTKDAGTGKTVTVENVTFRDDTNGLASNYTYMVNSGKTTATIKEKVIDLNGTKPYDGNANFDASDFGANGYIAGVGFETILLTGTGTVPSANIVNTRQPLSLGTLRLTDGRNGGWSTNYTLKGGYHFSTIINRLFTPSNLPLKQVDTDSESVLKSRKLQKTNPDDPFVITGNYILKSRTSL